MRTFVIGAVLALAGGSAIAGARLMGVQRVGYSHGLGLLSWSSDCYQPPWGIYGHDDDGIARAQAAYSSYYACLQRQAREDEAAVVRSIEDAAREEHEDVVLRGRLAGFIR